MSAEELIFKTNSKEYAVPANPDATMEDLIEIIRHTNPEFPKEFVLIFQGELIDLDAKVGSLGELDPDDSIYVRERTTTKTSIPRHYKTKSTEINTTADTSDLSNMSNQDKPPAPRSVPPRRPKRGIPMRDCIIPSENPPDFEEKVSQLMNFGNFDRESAEKALKGAFFDLDRAAFELFRKAESENEDLTPTKIPSRKSTDSQKGESNGNYSNLKQSEKDLISIMIQETGKDFATVYQLADACGYNEVNLRLLLSQE